MTQGRMARRWLALSSGATPGSLSAASVTRFSIPSIIEAELGRELERYTVSRMILRVTLKLASAGDAVCTVGVITHNEVVALGQVTPASNPSADWTYLDEVMVGATTDPYATLRVDVGGQRKSRGSEADTFIYIENRHASIAMTFHIFGRILVLLG